MSNHTNLTEIHAELGYVAADYVQICLYSLFAIIGLPVNISTLIYMLKRYRHAKSFLLLLHINLNISDILVLGLYVPGLIGWLVTFEWRGGNAMCKFMRFVDAFVFACSSNIMVCIALYRLSALRYPLWVNAVGHSRVPRMLVVAWMTAIVTMLPQVYVWSEVHFPEITQCITIWTEKLNSGEVLSETERRNMALYSIQNTVLIFYIPLIVLVACYVMILKDIYKTLNTEQECSSAMYFSEVSSSKTAAAKKEQPANSVVTISTRPIRGQEKFRRAKVRSLKITLLLILTYVVTWLPYNLLTWWMVFNFDSYVVNLDSNYILNSLVVLNSVINPFIYGRCQGVRLLFKCREKFRKKKKLTTTKKTCKLLQNN
ncbi:unnamed protein product [Caenorhabditis angaria]|uniref:G-protein coupled receptors family 1 profile domain-containing protein n=1 Tax=Caenorhabditis angaria TaxID=860376 RepID=A0A9P1N782_9PELO|nr:unnamed protein product [Caenorhabditis angaria]